jgi:ribonuclease R
MASRQKRKTLKDPNAEREAARYSRPIASREALLRLLHDAAEPMSYDEVAAALEFTNEDDLEALRRRLKAMVRDGQLLLNRREGYLPVDSENLVRGRIIAHPDGFGFLVPDEGGGDLYMNPREMRALMHGDRIVARVTGVDRRGRREGAIAEILERANSTVVGRLVAEGGVTVLVPDNKRIIQDVLIPNDKLEGAHEGQIAVAEITDQPTYRRQPVGRITRILGDRMAAGMEVDVAINSHGIPADWPDAVTAEAEALDDEVSAADKKGRKDLRRMPLVTIDGADSKDFDDAVYCEPKWNGWRLVVAIADVGAYVDEETALDAEAERRGTSVYFPNRVVPMLPEKLSNGLCSLNPEVDRLCLAADLRIGKDGTIDRIRFVEGIMRSHARLTYDNVADILVRGDDRTRERFAKVVPQLENLHGLFKTLLQARRRRGAIEFDSTETEIQFDDDGRIDSIEPVERNDAHRIIEECMVTANVAAARYLQKHRMPALYRVHNGPEGDQVDELRTFLAERGLRLAGGAEPGPMDFSRVLEEAANRPDAYLIQTVMLRSMQRAVYQPDCTGHFGLGLDEYAHFTSPIRRYPDLLVHRAIKHRLNGGRPRNYSYEHEDMVRFGDHCSLTERRADEATRDVEAVLKCQYMQEHVGSEFQGLITGVTSFGVFVVLDSMYAEGLVHVTSLPKDYYHFDPAGHSLTGERSGRVYRPGDPMRVKVTRVDIDERKIDFDPAEEAHADVKGSRRGGGRGRSGKKAASKKSASKKTAVKKAASKKTASKKKSGSGRSSRRRGSGGRSGASGQGKGEGSRNG